MLFCQDPMECIEFILKNPLFSGKINYQPRQDFDPSGGRMYSEWISSDGAWDLQVRTFLVSHYSCVLITCFNDTRADFQPTRLFSVSPYHPTRPGSAP